MQKRDDDLPFMKPKALWFDPSLSAVMSVRFDERIKYAHDLVGQDVLDVFNQIGFAVDDKTKGHQGNTSKILFGQSLGIVVRVINQDDFIHLFSPRVIAPIAWIRIPETYEFLTIHPGIDQPGLRPHSSRFKEDFVRRADKHYSVESTFHLLEETRSDEWYCIDAGIRNLGYIENDHTSRHVILDPECVIPRDTIINPTELYALYREKGLTAPRAFELVSMQQTQDTMYQGFVLRYRDLRDAFFDAWPTADTGEGQPDPEKLKHFYQLLHDRTEKPKRVVRYDRVNDTDGKSTMVTTGAYNEQLMRPWTAIHPDFKKIGALFTP